MVALDDPLCAPFADSLTKWFETHAADAVLVRPDRYVFGTGTPDALIEAWYAQLHQPCHA